MLIARSLKFQLNVISGEKSTLTASSKICMSCYKLYGIKKQLAQAKLGEQSSNPTLDAAGALIATQIDSIKLNFGIHFLES